MRKRANIFVACMYGFMLVVVVAKNVFRQRFELVALAALVIVGIYLAYLIRKRIRSFSRRSEGRDLKQQFVQQVLETNDLTLSYARADECIKLFDRYAQAVPEEKPAKLRLHAGQTETEDPLQRLIERLRNEGEEEWALQISEHRMRLHGSK